MAYHPFRHLGLKFLATAIAVALWFAVAGEQTVERSLRAPLALQNQPEHLELVENPPAQVDVRVRGAASLLSHMAPGDVVAMVDLSIARAGQRIFPITRDHVRAPFGVEVTQITPATLSLRFELSLTKRIPVVPPVEGRPATGYTTGKVTVEPASVEVVGAESSLRHLEEATTEPVSVERATQQVRETVHIGVSDASVRLRSPAVATVVVEVLPTPVERFLQGVPVRVRGLRKALAVQMTPALVSVSLRGPREAVDEATPASVDAYVDLAGLGPGRYNLPVRVDPPQNVEVLQADPARVRVRIR